MKKQKQNTSNSTDTANPDLPVCARPGCMNRLKDRRGGRKYCGTKSCNKERNNKRKRDSRATQQAAGLPPQHVDLGVEQAGLGKRVRLLDSAGTAFTKGENLKAYLLAKFAAAEPLRHKRVAA
jgi:hypothetical protein